MPRPLEDAKGCKQEENDFLQPNEILTMKVAMTSVCFLPSRTATAASVNLSRPEWRQSQEPA